MFHNMPDVIHHITNLSRYFNVIYALSLMVFGYFIATRVSHLAEKALVKRMSRHHILLVRRSIFYLIFAIFSVVGLQHLGFKLSLLLGAAGVFTVAISFASQTAVSNLISGIFLLFEHPFKVGDTVEIKGINGVVESIDLLSTKLKTPDNKLVRIPNEAMIKSEITNLSYFPTRRIDILITVAYDCDYEKLKGVLLNIAADCEQVLKEPAPSVVINSFASGSIELKLMAWVKTKQESIARTYMQEQINLKLERVQIDLTALQMTVHRI